MISDPDKKSVLLVEDEVALQEAAQMKLEKAGIAVYPARTGEDALKILETVRPSLVWLDLLLPGMNGLELLRRIRADESMKNLPVIIVSVSGGEEKIKEAFSLNVIDYIVKSQYTIEHIVKKAEEILKKT